MAFALAFLCIAFVDVSSAAPPSCKDGSRVNESLNKVEGTPCDDVIVVHDETVNTIEGGNGDDVIIANGEVEKIYGGDGEDHIYGEDVNTPKILDQLRDEGAIKSGFPIYRTADVSAGPEKPGDGEATASVVKYGGDGNQVIVGGAEDDWLYGQRGNDTVWGDATLTGENYHDLVSGGPGDDDLHGNNGWDILEGGYGADTLDGEYGNDMIRGDGSTDVLKDTGPAGDTDTLSYSTATAPGFVGSPPSPVMTNFPAEWAERGVYLRLDGVACSGEGGYEACNGDAAYGGGYDDIPNPGQFEHIIGSPFSDVIIGNGLANRIDGGGGADVIWGGEGADTLVGGADGDFLEGGAGTDGTTGSAGEDNCIAESKYQCEGEALEVHTRNQSKIEVGLMQVPHAAQNRSLQVYMVGSNAHDSIKALRWFDGATSTTYLSFELTGASAEFDTSASAQTEGCIYWPNVVHCPVNELLDSLLIAGMPSDDGMSIYEPGTMGEYTSTVMTGGTGSDVLWGGPATEDVLIDGDSAGNDWMFGSNWDDVLVNNAGVDRLQGGNGNDLFISNEVCGADYINGASEGASDGAGDNNASWAKLSGSGVVATLESNRAGNSYSSGPKCTFGALQELLEIDDLEGSNQADVLYGNGNPNGLFGRLGNDTMAGKLGVDKILAGNNGDRQGADVVAGDGGTDECEWDSTDTVTSCP
jgi:Ca2+-binding RTX toxin-like protein